MGPSGAGILISITVNINIQPGKTTFLSTLSGKAHYGVTTGKIMVNGIERPIRISSVLLVSSRKKMSCIGALNSYIRLAAAYQFQKSRCGGGALLPG